MVGSFSSRRISMESEPLLPRTRPPPPPPPPPPFPPPPILCPVPEDDEILMPIPVTPSELKERIIFGPSCSSPTSSPVLDCAFPLNPSFSHHASSSSSQELQNSWLTDLRSPPWTKMNLRRSKTAPAMAAINNDDSSSIHWPKFASQSIVRQAFMLLLLYLTVGVVIYTLNRRKFNAKETHPIVDGLYFCIVTMCTIGYGDITPNTNSTKLFAVFFVLVGFGFIDILLSGMVTHVLDLQENHFLRSAKAAGGQKEKGGGGSYIVDVKKGRMRIRLKVALALGVVVICIGIGMGYIHLVEKVGLLDSFYLSVVSVTTVGYGDIAFTSFRGRIFASIWLLVSTLAVARAFLFLAEARVHKRHRRLAKWILGQDMTIAQFLAADIDNDGFVSKSEYVIYKLKQMGKVSEKDVLEICQKFDRIDSGRLGKINLINLMDGHH